MSDVFDAAPDASIFGDVAGGGSFTPTPSNPHLNGRLLYVQPLSITHQKPGDANFAKHPDGTSDVLDAFVAVLDGGPIVFTTKDKDGNSQRHEMEPVCEFSSMWFWNSPIIEGMAPRLADGKPTIVRLRRFPRKGSQYKSWQEIEAAFEQYKRDITNDVPGATSPEFAWVMESVKNVPADVAKGVAFHNERQARLTAAAAESIF